MKNSLRKTPQKLLHSNFQVRQNTHNCDLKKGPPKFSAKVFFGILYISILKIYNRKFRFEKNWFLLFQSFVYLLFLKEIDFSNKKKQSAWRFFSHVCFLGYRLFLDKNLRSQEISSSVFLYVAYSFILSLPPLLGAPSWRFASRNWFTTTLYQFPEAYNQSSLSFFLFLYR